MVSEINIFEAVKRLCECILSQRTSEDVLSCLNLNKIAMKCYEILLRNSQTSSREETQPQATGVDMLWKENFLNAFELREKCALSGDSSFEDYEQLQSIVEELQDKSISDSSILQDAITFLLAIKDENQQKVENEVRFQGLSKIIRATSLNSAWYLLLKVYWYAVPDPIPPYWQRPRLVTSTFKQINSSVYPSFKDKEFYHGLDVAIFQKGHEKKVLHDAIFGNFPKGKSPRPPERMFGRFLYKYSPMETPEKPRKKIDEATKGNRKSEEKIIPTRYGWDWDSLGKQYVSITPKFITSTTELHQFVKLHKQETHELYSPIFATKEQLSRCLKCLAVGMPSELFYIDENIQFRLERQVTIDSLLPGTSVNIIKEFLECGSCYCRFQTLISYSDDRRSTFKALCGALENYLTSFRLHVFMKENEEILTFYSRIRKEMHQLIELGRILAAHPETDISTLPLSGSKLLGYLHTEIMQCVDDNMTTLLLFIFKCCCSVYFKCLQDWVFKGILDDPSGELFIHFLDMYQPKTKYFFDRAYTLRKTLIPEFILGIEDVILQCGKYVQLLKEFQPMHPLIRLDSPRFSVCLFHDEIIELRTNCDAYVEKVRQSCGEPMSFRQLFEQRAIEQENLRATAAQERKKNKADYEERKLAMRKAVTAEKARKFQQCKELTKQIAEQKRQQKKETLDYEMKYLNQVKMEETKYLMKENARLEASVQLYDELNNILDSQRQNLLNIVNNDPVSDMPPSETVDCSTDNANNNVEKNDTENNNDAVTAPFVSTKTSEKNIKDVRNRNSKLTTSSLQDKDKFTSLDNLTNIQRDSEVRITQSELGVHFCSLDSNQNASSKVESRSDLEINRAKMMHGDTFAELNKIPNPRKLYLDWNTERARNRQKVMESEFHLSCTPLAALSPMSTTSDFSTTSEEKCSKPSVDITYPDKNSFCHSQKITQYLRSETERQKNRRKVLESELNIYQEMGMKKSKTFELSDLGRNLFEQRDQFLAAGSIEEISEPELQQGVESREEISNGNVDENLTSKSIQQAPNFFSDWKTSDKMEKGDVLIKIESNDCTPSSDVGLPMEEQLRVDLEAARQLMGEKSTPSTFADLETPMSALLQQNLSNRAEFPFTFCINNAKQNTYLEDTPGIDYKSPTAFLNDTFGRPITSLFKLGKTDANEQRRKMEKELRQIRTELDVVLISTFIEQSLVLPLRAFSKLLNEEILQIFIKDLDILGHLEALRKYYFLMDGEVAQNICDYLFKELEEKSKHEAFSIPKLQLILKTSFINCLDGKYSERLSFTVGALPPDHPSSMPQELATLNMCYFVEWPLNLILNPETLMQYSSIFSFLLSIRRIRWCLERAHVVLKAKGQHFGKKLLLSPHYTYFLLVRYKFYIFVRALEHHFTLNALESTWQVFRDELQSIESIEDLYRKHVTYIKKIQFLCLRNRKSFEFAVAINNAFKGIAKYCRIIMQDSGWILVRRQKFITHKKFHRIKSLEAEFEQCVKYIIYLGKKVVNRGYQKEIEFFIDLINLNNIYQ